MEEFWKAALKVGGPVAIVGFLVWAFLSFFFEEDLLTLFNTTQQFVLVVLIFSVLAICLLAAIITWKSKSDSDSGNTATFIKSKIKGDVVLGDKNITSGKDHGE